jgi:hypothetical protein
MIRVIRVYEGYSSIKLLLPLELLGLLEFMRS